MRQAAIVTGSAIIIMTLAAIFAIDHMPGELFVDGNAAETTSNIQKSQMLFRAGIYGLLIILVCDVLAAWGLYILLRPVNSGLSLLTAWFRLIYVAILGTALLNYINVLLLTGGNNYLSVFEPVLLQAQVLILITAFNDTWSMGLIVFGLHILLAGYLVLKSGYMPKTFGILLILACIGYVGAHSIHLLFPDSEHLKALVDWIFIIPMVVGEVGLGVWLLIKHNRIKLADSILSDES